MADEPQATAPHLKITGLHLAGYRSIKQLDLPEDGIGWAGVVPDIMLVGGANGSGKTTLLEGLFNCFDSLFGQPPHTRPIFPGARELRLDLRVASDMISERTLRLVAGNMKFVLANQDENTFIYPSRNRSEPWNDVLDYIDDPSLLANDGAPHILYFPSDRQLTFPESTQSFEESSDPERVAWRFKPAATYKDSLTNQLYQARFMDLNAKEEGQPGRATHFSSYADAFHRFVDDTKQLVWHNAKLRVRTADGILHGLPELSSGEKQVLIFAAELRRRWTPGSLVLIDEPELHLHAAWQSTLFKLITDLQRERGGQVILATQSHHMFGLGEVATKVVLRKGWP